MINILFCGNDKVFCGMLTAILSILKRTTTREAFNFYIYTMDASHIDARFCALGEGDAEYLDKIVRTYNPENLVTRIDVLDIYTRELSGCPNESTSYSPYTLLRLLCDLVGGMPDKLLYLDVDILLNRDITELWNIDVEGYEYAAARDHYGKYLVSPNYINAGVLLLNLKEIRKTGLFCKARETLREKKLILPDQSAIRLNTEKGKLLPQKFNDQKFLHEHTVVRHFAKRMFWLPYPHIENIKQWQISRVHRAFGYTCFDDIFDEYIYYKEKFNREVQK